MLCTKRKIKLFNKIILFFMMVLLSFPLYATKNVVYLDHASIGSASCDETDCFFPEKSLSDKDIRIKDQINWNKDKGLILHTKGNIIFEKGAKILGGGSGSIILKSGMEPGEKDEDKYNGTVKFEEESPQVETKGKVRVYYNPTQGKADHRYLNPEYNYYRDHIKAENINLYMLVNDVYDLQSIGAFLSGSYALSQNIEAAETKNWNGKKGFEPLREGSMSFSGNFDGNGYSINGLFIDRGEEDDVGLFGKCGKSDILHNTIENLTLKKFDIKGSYDVGSLAGLAANSDWLNIKIINPRISSKNIAGGLVGTADRVVAETIQIAGNVEVVSSKGKDNAFIVGGASKSTITVFFETEQKRNDVLKTYRLLGNGDDKTQICLKSNDVRPTICLYNNPTGDQTFDDKFLYSPKDPTKIGLIINIETLTPLAVMHHILEASSVFNQCIEKNKDKNGDK